MGPFGVGLTYLLRKLREGSRPIGPEGGPLEGESAIAFFRKRQLETNTPLPFIEWEPKEGKLFCCYKCFGNSFNLRMLYLEAEWNPLPLSEHEKKITHIFICVGCGSKITETQHTETVKATLEKI